MAFDDDFMYDFYFYDDFLNLNDLFFRDDDNSSAYTPLNCTAFFGESSLSMFNQLSGTLPTEIGLLTDLTDLYLSSNSMYGTIPTEIGQLVGLKSLWLTGNSMVGQLPSEVGRLTGLNEFIIRNGVAFGALPSQLGMLTAVTWLDLSFNRFTGALPTELGLLTAATSFDARTNDFHGTLPSEFGLLTGLSTDFVVKNNRLCGPLPSELSPLRDHMLTDDADLWEQNVEFGNDLDVACVSSAPTSGPTVENVSSDARANLFFNAGAIFGAVGALFFVCIVALLFRPARHWWESRKRRSPNMEEEWKDMHSSPGDVEMEGETIEAFYTQEDGGFRKSTATAPRFSVSRWSSSTHTTNNPMVPSLQENTEAFRIAFDLLSLPKKPFAAGASGSLFKGTYNGTVVAAKMLYSHSGDKERGEFDREFKMLAMMRHPNVVQLYGMAHNPSTDSLFIVQEFVGGGDVRSLLQGTGGGEVSRHFGLPELVRLASELLGAVRYMHASGVAHRDLKPLNLLVTETGSLRVCDLGLARNYMQSQITANVGTALYMPAEAFDDEKTGEGYDASTWDAFSVGVILYEFWHRVHPWEVQFLSNSPSSF